MKDKIVEIYNKHIKEKPYLKNDNVLLFIEGLGNYKGKAIKDITLHPKGRMGAIFAIITKDGELFYTTSASTLPDIPMGEGKYNDDTPTPTLELGVYNVYSKLHKGKYAMELGLGNESVPVIRRSGYPGSTGIDIHSRPIDDYKNAACFAGCLTISKSQFTRMLEILGVTNKGKFIGGGHYIGKVIIDRSYITEDLQKLYKEIYGSSYSSVFNTIELIINQENISSWAKESWKHCKKEGINDGIGPKNNVTEEQLMVFLSRMENYIVKKYGLKQV
ncbi:hypothetical protein SH1V18_02790 [Vallitalea longa]|uniref:Uncharacterized protein n=1 Tax=Vallitalea longa TaxID=2936439 RepID=A0A9W6DEP5_9FIRM|nr:hypothetical protein [Vallitalea longa]GKX27799.1 hypothetical protein SH1V18_02790 [Vallitalea longa]